MPCTSILKAWIISISIHALVLGGATWVLNEIQAPPPEQVFRWDIALASGSASSADQASAGVRAEPTAEVIQAPRRVMKATTRLVHREIPKIVASAVTTRVDQSSRPVTSARSLQRTVSRQSPTRTVTEKPLTELSAPTPATQYVQVVRPLTVEKTTHQPPQDSVFAKPASRPVEQALPREQRGADVPQVVNPSRSVIERTFVAHRAPAEHQLAATSNAEEAYVKAIEGFTSTATALPQPHIATERSASVVQRPSPVVVDEPAAVIPAANGVDTHVQSTSGMRQKSASVAVGPELEIKAIKPLAANLVTSLAEVSKIEDGTSTLEVHKHLPIEMGTLVAKAGPRTKSDFGWLAKSMHRRIANLMRYPYRARVNHWEGKVVLRAVIADDGRLANVSVKRSSGYEILDQEAMELVRRVCPVPLKHPLGRPQVVMHIPITYKLEN